jgi:hypothetical protein
VDFHVIGQKLISSSTSVRCCRESGSIGRVHQLFIDLMKAYDSVKREALYNILNESGIPRKLAGLIKVCLN